MATGFLTGALSHGHIRCTRFDSKFIDQIARQPYDSKDLRDACSQLENVSQKYGIKTQMVGLMWIFHHSVLGKDDAMILDASEPSQLKENMGAIARSALTFDLTDTIEQ